MAYVDGFLIAVPKANIERYKKMAATGQAVWKDHGAIDYVECIADDVPYGELTSFPRAVHATEEETVIFAWVTWNSKEERDAANPKIMEDPRFDSEDWKDVFDGKRMIYGGFRPFLGL